MDGSAAPDLGPAVRLERKPGKRGPARDAPGRIALGYRPDPVAPGRLVRGARAVGPHHRLLRERRITPWQFEAAEAFARYWQECEVGRSPDPDLAGARRAPWERAGGRTMAQVAAGQRLQQAREVVGLVGEEVLRAVCVSELPLHRAFDAVFPHLAGGRRGGPSEPVRRAVVQGMLVVALDVLARAWRIGPRAVGLPR